MIKLNESQDLTEKLSGKVVSGCMVQVLHPETEHLKEVLEVVLIFDGGVSLRITAAQFIATLHGV
jgi:hypothetical protein